MIDILLNEQNFVSEYNLISNGNSFGDLTTQINDNDLNIQHFEENFTSYKYENDGLILKEEKLNEDNLNKQKNKLRKIREIECFPYINRGSLWYATLTESQLTNFQNWYTKWLNVTETLIIPEKPNWL